MSDLAREAYQRERQEQSSRNDARKIRAKVKDARNNPHEAGGRWPFELLQNACDAGPRVGLNGISVHIDWHSTDAGIEVSFKHDAAPFRTRDLTALLSGGSSKDFDSDATTGRFGTGFLVTHILSYRVTIEGLLELPSQTERFEITLDREGDEEAILASRDAADEHIRLAQPVNEIDGHPSASFRWLVTHLDAYHNGVDALAKSLPYVFATCPQLARVTLRDRAGVERVWRADPLSEHAHEHLRWTERAFTYESGGQTTRFAILRTGDVRASALALVREETGSRRIVVPESDVPRLFRRFPLRGTTGLPIRLVLDGSFDVDQERRAASIEASGDRIKEALEAAVSAVQVAFHLNLDGAHLLCFAGSPLEIHDEPAGSWWRAALASFAHHLSTLPLIDTPWGSLPSVWDEDEDSSWVDFPRPVSAGLEMALPRLWRLMMGLSHYAPPDEPIVGDWVEIAEGWASNGVELTHITLQDVAAKAREGAREWMGMEQVDEPETWLLDFIDCIGEIASTSNVAIEPYLDGLLPDQTGVLRRCRELLRDTGIPEELKDIAHALDIPIRTRLLNLAIEGATRDGAWPHLAVAIDRAISGRLGETGVIEDCINALSRTVARQKRLDEKGRSGAETAARLLAFLWTTKGTEATRYAHRLPLLTLSGHCDEANDRRQLLLPISRWPETARPYAEAWPPERILDEIFASDTLIEAVTGVGIAPSGFIVSKRVARLEGPRLAGLIADGTIPPVDLTVDVDGMLDSVALLEPEVMNRCAANPEAARALLGFILDHLAAHDDSWRSTVTFTGRRNNAPQPVELRKSLWVGEVRSRHWVRSESKDAPPVRASSETLRPWLNDKVLDSHAIDLLTTCFGFDALDLRLIGQSDAVRDQLAALMAQTGGDPRLIQFAVQAVQAAAQRETTVNTLRDYGLAVQHAVARALEERLLSVRLVDRGYDYEVEPEDRSLTQFALGPWLVEVKATVTGEVRMTPLQAQTAALEPDRYVLCVVALDELPDPDAGPALDVEVRAKARIITDIGPDADATTAYVAAAEEGEVRLRNSHALRYAVLRPRWEEGMTIDEWIDSIQPKLETLDPTTPPRE